MLNHIDLVGRLVRDPELRYTPSGTAVASFTIAVERDYKSEGSEKQADFIDVVAWRQTGEFVAKFFKKGNMAVVSGRLQIRDWQDKDGNKRKNAEVVAEHIYFGEGRSNQNTAKSDSGGEFEGSFKGSAFSELDAGDGDLPF